MNADAVLACKRLRSRGFYLTDPEELDDER